jgi:glycosyltransferase involved in cell wall biosynthesis
MRILYVSDAQSIHTRRWAEFFRDSGADIHVASFRAADIPGVVTHLLPTFGLGKLGYLVALLSLRVLYRRLQPDVVHAQYVTSYGFLSAFAGLHPLVLTAWGTDVLLSPKESRLMRCLASYAVKHADAVTTVAQHMNPSVAALGIAESAVSAVPFGVDTERFVPPSGHRPESDTLHLICTRNFAPIYDVGTLITALQRAAQRGLRLQVDLVGEGSLRSELEARVMRAGISSWVTFHGHVDHDRLAQLLAQADIFVSPALSDGNNVSLNEAMACAAFPIGTNIPANAQWIEDGVNGLLYPPGDADALTECILRAASDATWRARAGKLNRNIVEQRADWRVCVARMTDIYTRVIAEGRAH